MKNFFDFQDEKITEKAFSKNIIVSIAGILLSIVMLCSTTYAWFTTSISSNTNIVESGRFSISVAVARVASENAVAPSTSGVYNLSAGTYMITVEPTAESTVKGYCLIAANGAEYCTDVIVNSTTATDEYNANSPFVFYVTVSATTTLAIESRWGIPAAADILAGETVIL